ncbi:MAG: hypothetical protein EOO15_08600 [Chitinophagaceae bacterium]|nr:MAG: hypothetical protein EOO15_08600 [Chitinophagaceae bacterium]
MRNTVLLLLSILSLTTTIAQQKNTDSTAGIRDLVRVTFLNPGISYEKRIGRFQSMVVQAYGGLGFEGSDNTSPAGVRYDVYFEPGGSLQYRYYYNYNARSAAGRRTENNNLNFVGPLYQFAWARTGATSSFSPYEEVSDAHAVHNLGFVWGIQRNYPKRFSLDLGIGVGYLFEKRTRYTYSPNPPFTGTRVTENVSNYTFVGQFSLGFWLGKRR